MKFSSVCLVALSLAFACAAEVTASDTVAAIDAHITPDPILQKRYKDVIVNKDYKKLQELKEKGTEAAPVEKPWMRTIYGTVKEIVTPTVVAGVTFRAKPPATTDGLEPWISLKNDGSPKTIKPKMKNGLIKDKSPDYSTYFQTATTVRYTHEELKAHNMAEDEIYEEVSYIPEDLTYRLLNPVIRCTPQYYKNKGMGKSTTPEPFCFPRDNSRLYQDHTYFVTWYYPFFGDDVKNVKLHLSYVRESARQKGTKREFVDDSPAILDKRSVVMEQGGSLGKTSFFTSEWMPKEEGMFALDVNPDWLDGEYYKKVLISLQPDTMSDDEFDHMANFIVVEFAQRARVAKGHQEDIKATEERQKMKALYGDDWDVEEGLDYEKYMIIITMPTCVVVAALLMYAFVWYNSRGHDLSFLKKVKFNKRRTRKLKLSKKKDKYSELPQWEGPKAD